MASVPCSYMDASQSGYHTIPEKKPEHCPKKPDLLKNVDNVAAWSVTLRTAEDNCGGHVEQANRKYASLVFYP